jgi:hypothetical protein
MPIDERKLEILTKRQQLQSIPARIRRQYPGRIYFGNVPGQLGEPSGAALAAAIERIDVDSAGAQAAIDALIGNGSWTAMSCCLCGEDVDKIAIIDEDYESGARICLQCAEVIVYKLKGVSDAD